MEDKKRATWIRKREKEKKKTKVDYILVTLKKDWMKVSNSAWIG